MGRESIPEEYRAATVADLRPLLTILDSLRLEVRELRAHAEGQGERWPDVMDGPTAQRYLGICKSTLHKLTREGFLPAVRYSNRAVRYRRQDLDALLEKKLDGTKGRGAAKKKAS